MKGTGLKANLLDLYDLVLGHPVSCIRHGLVQCSVVEAGGQGREGMTVFVCLMTCPRIPVTPALQ